MAQNLTALNAQMNELLSMIDDALARGFEAAAEELQTELETVCEAIDALQAA